MSTKDKTLVMKNRFGKVVEVPMGYSFTTLIFQFLPDLFRGNLTAVAVVLGIDIFFAFVTQNYEMNLVFSFILYAVYASMRNKRLVEFYLRNDYKIVNPPSDEVNLFMGYTVDKGAYDV